MSVEKIYFPTNKCSFVEKCSSVIIYCWICIGRIIICEPNILHDPKEWEWKMVEEKLFPHWTELPNATMVSHQLIKCSCNPENSEKDAANVSIQGPLVKKVADVKKNVKKIKQYVLY